ncbi:hypothetical protein LCGC14_0872730 [marine sediment metagenome]|uniref:Uncharacterized protein n=1 Tax=marine sediment metagenome TaxID=412755 RepID=A0A0F9P477_9ZZZZ
MFRWLLNIFKRSKAIKIRKTALKNSMKQIGKTDKKYIYVSYGKNIFYEED